MEIKFSIFLNFFNVISIFFQFGFEVLFLCLVFLCFVISYFCFSMFCCSMFCHRSKTVDSYFKKNCSKLSLKWQSWNSLLIGSDFPLFMSHDTIPLFSDVPKMSTSLSCIYTYSLSRKDLSNYLTETTFFDMNICSIFMQNRRRLRSHIKYKPYIIVSRENETTRHTKKTNNMLCVLLGIKINEKKRQ